MRAAMTARKYDVIVVGGGASGLFAAAEILSHGFKVLILEPNRFLGRKLRITGKGRCNLTNDCSADEVIKNISRNPKFLYSALRKFPPEKIMHWFEAAGVPLKTERGRRVFPQSDSANDVAEALVKKCSGADVRHEKALSLTVSDGCILGIKTSSCEYFSDIVILAAGGLSYPKTGSDGSGYKLAESVGHTVTPLRPSLVPILCRESLPEIDLKNVSLIMYRSDRPGKPVWQEQGELSLGPNGLSGPLALTASCMFDSEQDCKGYLLYIDFKPALSEEKLDARLLREIQANPKENMTFLLRQLLPSTLTDVFIHRLNADFTASLGNLSKQTRLELVRLLKKFPIEPAGLGSYDEAIITRGGIDVKEISPKTMESKLVKGLYFTGEIIDVDGFTGGYNLTEAFSTAYSAAEDIIRKKEETLHDN